MAQEKSADGPQIQEASRSTSNADETRFLQDIEQQSGQNDGASDATEKAALKDPNIVDWEADDPENPLNWSSAKKSAVVVVVAFITMLS